MLYSFKVTIQALIIIVLKRSGTPYAWHLVGLTYTRGRKSINDSLGTELGFLHFHLLYTHILVVAMA